MAVSHDTNSSGSVIGPGSGTQTLTVAHVVGTLTKGLLLVGVAIGDPSSPLSASSVSGVTFNGTAMSKIADFEPLATNGWMWLYQLTTTAGLANGNHNIVVTFSISSDVNATVIAGGVSFEGVLQATPVTGSGTTNAAISTNASVTLSSVVNDMVCGIVAAGSGISSTDQTPAWLVAGNNDTTAGNAAMHYTAGAASVTLTSTIGSSDDWGYIAVDIKNAAVPGNIAWIRA